LEAIRAAWDAASHNATNEVPSIVVLRLVVSFVSNPSPSFFVLLLLVIKEESLVLLNRRERTPPPLPPYELVSHL